MASPASSLRVFLSIVQASREKKKIGSGDGGGGVGGLPKCCHLGMTGNYNEYLH